MSVPSLKLNDEDRRVYERWRWNIILLWGFIVAAMAIICTVPTLESSPPVSGREDSDRV